MLRYALNKAKEMGPGAVFMGGDIDFHKHVGLVLASSMGVNYHAGPRESEVTYFLCLELKEGYLSGIEGTCHTALGYYAAFDNSDGFEECESGFPFKKNLVLSGQLY